MYTGSGCKLVQNLQLCSLHSWLQYFLTWNRLKAGVPLRCPQIYVAADAAQPCFKKYWGDIKLKEMETIIVDWEYIWDNRKENGNYHSILGISNLFGTDHLPGRVIDRPALLIRHSLGGLLARRVSAEPIQRPLLHNLNWSLPMMMMMMMMMMMTMTRLLVLVATVEGWWRWRRRRRQRCWCGVVVSMYV